MSLIVTGLWAHALYCCCGYAIQPVKTREARRALAQSDHYEEDLALFACTQAMKFSTPLALTLNACQEGHRPLFLGSDLPEGIEDFPFPPVEILVKEDAAPLEDPSAACHVAPFRGTAEKVLRRLAFNGPRRRWPEIYVTAPEYQFVQAAQRRSPVQAALMGAGLSGFYRARPDYPEGCTAPEDPLMTKESATRFIAAWPDADEAEKARSALAIMPERARLAPIASTALLLCLPEEQGGYGLEWPELSAKPELTPEAREVLDNGGTKDEVSAALGVDVLHVGLEDFETVEGLDRLVQEHLAPALGAGKRHPNREKQRALHREMMGPHWWW